MINRFRLGGITLVVGLLLAAMLLPSTAATRGTFAMSLSAKSEQHADHLRVKVECSIACQVKARAKGRVGTNKWKSRATRVDLPANDKARVPIFFSQRTLNLLEGKTTVARITVEATNPAYDATLKDRLRVTLVP
jgi:hypothetical protein